MGISRKGLNACAAIFAIMGFAGAGWAQSVAGAEEYTRACASCHGLTGHGDGPLAEYMSIPVPDVTQIRARNNGVFPMLEVIHLVDGRSGLRGHGGPMPIWGDRFEAAVASEMGDVGTEIAVRGRVLALATYLEAIQQ
ncbi:c-type cytochrome [Roseicyclus sp.]|uniref:c-type cytochrome n=1 Tax=Roseicyclus sp. TaxID=1914329 RepID=UPI003F6BBB31